MAEGLGEISLKLSADIADLKKGIELATGHISKLGPSTVATGVLTADAFKKMGQMAIQFGKEGFMAFAEQEQAVIRLTKAVGKDAAGALMGYASQLQKTTSFSDDSIISLQVQLANYGILPGSIKKATTALIEYSAQTGKKLPEAGAILSQALKGQSKELNAMGLALDANATSAENLETAVTFLQKRFAGASQELKGTTLGTLDNLKNRLDEIKKKVGEDLVNAFKFWQPWIEKAVSWIEKLTGVTAKQKSVSELGIDALQKEREEIIRGAKAKADAHDGIVRLSDQEQKRLMMITRQIGVLKEDTQAQKESNKEVVLATGVTDDYLKKVHEREAAEKLALAQKKKREDEKRKLDEESARLDKQLQEELTKDHRSEWLKRIDAANDARAQLGTFSQQLKVRMTEDVKEWSTICVDVVFKIRDSFASGMADVIVNGGSFKEKFKEIGKNILQYFIEEVIKQMVTRWLAGIATMNAANATLGSPGGGGLGSLLGLGGGAAPAAGGAGPSAASGASGAAGAGTGLSAFLSPAGNPTLARVGVGVVAGSFAASKIMGSSGNAERDASLQKSSQLFSGVGSLIAGPVGGVVAGAVFGFLAKPGNKKERETNQALKKKDEANRNYSSALSSAVTLQDAMKITDQFAGSSPRAAEMQAHGYERLKTEIAMAGQREGDRRTVEEAAARGIGVVELNKERMEQSKQFALKSYMDSKRMEGAQSIAAEYANMFASNNDLTDLRRRFNLQFSPEDLTGQLVAPILREKYMIPLAGGGIVNEPAIFRTLKTGKMGIMGEAGPEAIVPLGGKGGGMGGTVININITGQFLEADDAKWDKLVRDKIVIPLERMRRKTSSSVL